MRHHRFSEQVAFGFSHISIANTETASYIISDVSAYVRKGAARPLKLRDQRCAIAGGRRDHGYSRRLGIGQVRALIRPNGCVPGARAPRGSSSEVTTGRTPSLTVSGDVVVDGERVDVSR